MYIDQQETPLYTRLFLIIICIAHFSCSSTQKNTAQQQEDLPEYVLHNRFTEALLYGHAALLREDMTKAIELLNQARSIYPHHPEVHFRLSQAHIGNTYEALTFAKKACDITQETEAEYHLHYASLLAATGDLKSAIKHLQTISPLFPFDGFIATRLNQYLLQNRSYKEALQLWNTFEKSTTPLHVIMATLNKSLIYQSINDHAKSVSLLEKGIQEHPLSAALLTAYFAAISTSNTPLSNAQKQLISEKITFVKQHLHQRNPNCFLIPQADLLSHRWDDFLQMNQPCLLLPQAYLLSYQWEERANSTMTPGENSLFFLDHLLHISPDNTYVLPLHKQTPPHLAIAMARKHPYHSGLKQQVATHLMNRFLPVKTKSILQSSLIMGHDRMELLTLHARALLWCADFSEIEALYQKALIWYPYHFDVHRVGILAMSHYPEKALQRISEVKSMATASDDLQFLELLERYFTANLSKSRGTYLWPSNAKLQQLSLNNTQWLVPLFLHLNSVTDPGWNAIPFHSEDPFSQPILKALSHKNPPEALLEIKTLYIQVPVYSEMMLRLLSSDDLSHYQKDFIQTLKERETFDDDANLY
jgi:tetratricopeptide (TPR) repeat protein